MIKIKYESAKITMIIHVHVHVGLMLVKIFLWEPMSKTFSHCWFIYNIMWLRNDLIIVLNKVFLIIKALLYKPTFLCNKNSNSVPSSAESNHPQVFLLFLQGKTFRSLH